MIAISPAPAVISLSDVERLRDEPAASEDSRDLLHSLVGGYSLESVEARAAFGAIVRSLSRAEDRGDAFVIQGVYGTGKSHLLALIDVLCAHPEQAWPVFQASHPDFEVPEFASSRLVVAVPLDEYPAQTHDLEHIVLSRIEAELAQRHGVHVALTEESHLLNLVQQYVLPQAGDALDGRAKAVCGRTWMDLRHQSPTEAAELALAFVREASFPLDWHRSRAEAWGALRRALQDRGVDGPVLLLDELGTFLAGKDGRELNADASFLQYLAQRSLTDRCWLICVTQRGLEEVGDVDRRTVRQLRDRFRPAFTLDLSGLGWLVEHRLVRKRDASRFRETVRQLHADYCAAAGDTPFSTAELTQSYPLNPLCLEMVQHAAETCLSRTRSAVRLLQETLAERGRLKLPAERLLTPDVAFGVFRSEMALSPSGQRHLHAFEVVMGNAGRIAPGREAQLAPVMKTLCMLGIGELRYSERDLRNSLVGCEEAEIWQRPGVLSELLRALRRRGSYVERSQGEGEVADGYYIDVSSDTSERIRQRLNELVAELTPADSRVARATLEACRGPAFPLAGLAEAHAIGVVWAQARRFTSVVCRDLTGIARAELQNLAGELASPSTREDGRLFLALPTISSEKQEAAWRRAGEGIEGRFAAGLLAWLPRELTDADRDRLVDHAALALMVADRTLARRRDRGFKDKLRARWTECEEEVRQILQRAYYNGRVIALDGENVVEPERLPALFGDWEETLAAVLSASFRELFPRFEVIAPGRRLVGRARTNQIIDQFIRPGRADLPPASTLESHLVAYAAPLGLVEGEERHPRLALRRRDLVAAGVEAVPERAGNGEIEPHEAIPYRELAGRLAKSEWGLTQEQSELLVATLIRRGHLVALDAFLQPVRLDLVSAPLGDSLAYVMRGAAMPRGTAGHARSLWQSAVGSRDVEWNLPAQERAWDDMIAWAARLSANPEERRVRIAEAAERLGQVSEDWAWAEHALGRAEAAAGNVDSSLASREGLAKLVSAVEKLPGGVAQTAALLARWEQCERFFEQHLDELVRLHRLLADGRMHLPEGSMLAREHRSIVALFAAPEKVVSDPASAQRAGQRWLTGYRRHYLAWHSRVHAPTRFEALGELRRSAALDAAQRLARAGLRPGDAASIQAEVARAIGQRCLAGNPLPEGRVVCPICDVRLGRQIELPDAAELARSVSQTVKEQLSDLTQHNDLLERRLAGCRDEQVKEAVSDLVCASPDTSPEELNALLSEGVVTWLRQQIAQPRARRRKLSALVESLRGKELTRREVIRIIEDWLQAGELPLLGIVIGRRPRGAVRRR